MALRKQVYFKDSEMLDMVKDFLSKQSNFSDSIMFLIEQEIAQHGIRNLGNFIPQVRSTEYWNNYLKENPISNVAQVSSSSEPVLDGSDVSSLVDSSVVNPFRAEKKEAESVDIPACYDD